MAIKPKQDTQEKEGTQAEKVSPDVKKDEATETPKEKPVTESKDSEMLKALIEQNKKIMANFEVQSKQLEEAKREIKAIKEAKSTAGKTIDEEIIDDYLENPVAFFSYSPFSVHSYRFRGKVTLPPEKAIQFKIKTRQILGSGAQAKFHTIAVASIQSKRELEFLRNAPGYGFKFFEKMPGANIDTTMAEVTTKHHSIVSGYTDARVLNEAQALEIPIVDDIAKLRRAIVQKRSEKEIAVVNKRFKEQEAEVMKEAMRAAEIKSSGTTQIFDKVEL